MCEETAPITEPTGPEQPQGQLWEFVATAEAEVTKANDTEESE
jgi:hypothetical protein